MSSRGISYLLDTFVTGAPISDEMSRETRFVTLARRARGSLRASALSLVPHLALRL